MTQAPRLAASERRAQLLAIAVDLAGRYGLNAVTRELLASSAKVSPSLVTLYWPLRGARELETPGLRDAIVSEAVRLGKHAVVLQGLALGVPSALALDSETKRRAARAAYP